ncbi:MAG: DUF1016 N-terminal domain-containing protein, partial [Oscillospiraceae bacterium]|nr:DUF1016 N-terminal domain-containing protein [Oscillospiraceae bacterium]
MSEFNNASDFNNATVIIKEAIIRSRYQAATLVNKELLALYYAVGKYVSENSRGAWGKGAIRRISNDLQKELLGLRGFSDSSIKNMRAFYEGWQPIFTNRQLPTGDLQKIPFIENEIDLSLLKSHISGFSAADDYYKVGFTHHS